MITYEITGYLYYFKEFEPSFKSPLNLEKDNLRVSIENNKDDNRLEVHLRIDSEEQDLATAIAGDELERISNRLSWFHKIPIIKWELNNLEYLDKEEKRQRVLFAGSGHYTLGGSPCNLSNIGDEENIKRELVKDYNDNSKGITFDEILRMWREAFIQQSTEFKYLLFYRILEKLCSNVDEYVKDKIKDVEMRLCQRRGNVTIFTYLRDNIHPKTSTYPFQEIKQYLPKLYDLVVGKIKEEYSL